MTASVRPDWCDTSLSLLFVFLFVTAASLSRYPHAGCDRTNSNPANPFLEDLLMLGALSEKIESPMSDRLVDVDNPCERAGRRLDSRHRKGSFAMTWFYCLMVALGTAEKDAAE